MSTKPAPIFQFPELRVVEASAGSGKTYALAKRYVQLLLSPALKHESIPIRTILAITFTNKAAYEMKVRIIEFLKLIAFQKLTPLQEKDILEPLNITKQEGSQRAFQVMDDIIHHYNFFLVQTIDKFINAILSGSAFKLGLTANFKIRTNFKEYLEYSLDELVDQAAGNPQLERLFQEFLQNYLYLENRSGWFPKQDMLCILVDLFSQINTYGLPLRTTVIPPDTLIKTKYKLLEDIKALRNQMPEGIDKRFQKILEDWVENHPKGFDIDSISDYFARPEIPIRKGTEVSPETEKLWKKIHRDLKALSELEAHHLFDPYIAIFALTMQNFQHISSREDILFLSELNKQASRLFGEGRLTVQELYYRLATRFRHYLMDEFQDTSRLQWQNLEMMIEEALSTGGTLFYVGDRKQAIYQFRGGDVSLFDEVKAQYNHFNVNEESLSQNWRSRQSIINFNNNIFAMSNLKSFLEKKEQFEGEKNKANAVCFTDEDWNTISHAFHMSEQKGLPTKEGGLVKVELVDASNKEERNDMIREKVIALVHQLEKRFSFSEIAFLTRGNDEVEELTNWLLEEGYSVESERTSNIKENAIIQELVLFLKFLLSPVDNVSFSHFILGDLFTKVSGISSQELHAFVFSQRPRLSQEKGFYLYMEFRSQYPKVWENLIEDFFKNIGLYPLYELLISIYSCFDLLKHFGNYQGFLMHFLNLVKVREDDYPEASSFLDYFENAPFEDLYVQVTNTHAIKIMTVHKAKGLEFPVVILPFLGMDVQVGSQGADQKQSYILQRTEEAEEIELIRLKSKYLKFSEKLNDMYSGEYKKAFLSELNNIYVALTRAVDEMYVFMPSRYGSNTNLIPFLIPETHWQVGQEVHKREIKTSKEHIHMIEPSQYQDWIKYLKEEFLHSDELKNKVKRKQGEIVHYLLSFVKNLNASKLETILKEAIEHASIHYADEQDWKTYEKIVNAVVNHDQLKRFFYLNDEEVVNECELITSAGHGKRVDRLIIGTKTVTVVDYKLAKLKDSNYQAQVKDYMKLVKELHSEKTVTGFIVYTNQLECEEVV